MMLQMVRAKRRQVLVDINTQRDFFLADGVVCIRNHRRVLAHVRRLMAWARTRDIPVVSTCEVYANHHSHNGDPRYCIDGTEGQWKIPYTLLNSRICFAADGSTGSSVIGIARTAATGSASSAGTSFSAATKELRGGA